MTQARDLADGKFDTNTLVVDAANNHVGVGTASPSLPLHINGASAGDGLVYSRSGTEYFRIDDTGTDMNIKTTGGGHQIIFTTNSSEVGRWRNGGGLTFNGDTAAANALDDYEEGTWTPSVGGTATYSTRMGRYQKVGNIVHAQFEITINSIGTGNAVVLSGWPYASANLGTVQTGVCSYYANSATNITWLALYIENNASTSQFVASDGTASAGVLNGPSIFGNSTVVFGAISYFMA